MSSETYRPGNEVVKGFDANILSAPIDSMKVNREAERDFSADPHIVRVDLMHEDKDLGEYQSGDYGVNEDTESFFSDDNPNVSSAPRIRSPKAKIAMVLAGVAAIVSACAANPAIVAGGVPNIVHENTPSVSAPISEVTPTEQPTVAPTPTEAPKTEIGIEELSQIDPALGSFTEDEEGRLIYNSALESEVGKNVVFVREEREIGLSGGPEIHFSPADHPNAPAVIYEVDTGEFRKGPFGYIDIEKDLMLHEGYDTSSSHVLDAIHESKIPSNYIDFIEGENFTMYALSAFPQEVTFDNRGGYFAFHVATPISTNNDNYALFYDVILSPYEKRSTYRTYTRFVSEAEPGIAIALDEEYSITKIRAGDKDFIAICERTFGDALRVGTQTLLYGMRWANSNDDVPRSELGIRPEYISSYRLSYEMEGDMDILFSVLNSGALPDNLTEVGDALRLFGVAQWYFNNKVNF